MGILKVALTSVSVWKGHALQLVYKGTDSAVVSSDYWTTKNGRAIPSMQSQNCDDILQTISINRSQFIGNNPLCSCSLSLNPFSQLLLSSNIKTNSLFHCCYGNQFKCGAQCWSHYGMLLTLNFMWKSSTFYPISHHWSDCVILHMYVSLSILLLLFLFVKHLNGIVIKRKSSFLCVFLCYLATFKLLNYF